MGERRALGKGLAALLGDRPAPAAGEPGPAPSPAPAGGSGEGVGGVRLIAVAEIEPNPDQPRETFEDEPLRELAASIAQDGIIQPLVVREDGGRFILIAGERRWRAAKMAGLAEVPAMVHTLRGPTDSLRLSLIENIQRRDLNPMEEAHAYQELMQRCDYTQERLAQELSKGRSGVTNTLRLLNLPGDVQKLIANGRLSMGHARAILAVPRADLQRRIAQRVVEEGLSVREAEELAGINSPRPKKADPPPRRPEAGDPYFASLEAKLRSALGTKVTIKRTGTKSGQIVIDYYSLEEAEGILARLGVDPNE